AMPSPSRYTPASSLVSKPTSTFGSVGRGKRRKTKSSNPGLSFAAQPAALTMAVSFTESVKPHLAVKRFDYSEVRPFVLARDRPLDACARHAESVLIRGCPGISG